MPATLAKVRTVYAERAKAMGEALTRELGDAVEFEQPQGGLFFWARLTGKGGKLKDASEFAKRAIDQGVAFVPGVPFYAADADAATFRLSFATADVEKILEGVGRLGKAPRTPAMTTGVVPSIHGGTQLGRASASATVGLHEFGKLVS